jgi:hypothetical protein
MRTSRRPTTQTQTCCDSQCEHVAVREIKTKNCRERQKNEKTPRAKHTTTAPFQQRVAQRQTTTKAVVILDTFNAEYRSILYRFFFREISSWLLDASSYRTHPAQRRIAERGGYWTHPVTGRIRRRDASLGEEVTGRIRRSPTYRYRHNDWHQSGWRSTAQYWCRVNPLVTVRTFARFSETWKKYRYRLSIIEFIR